MLPTALQAARDYVRDAAGRSVMAVSPRSLCRRLGCSDEEAIALVGELARVGEGELKAYVTCVSCSESFPLAAASLFEVYREAGELIGTCCRNCHSVIVETRKDAEVHLSFFPHAVAGSSPATATLPTRAEPSNFQLEQVAAATKINPSAITVNVNVSNQLPNQLDAEPHREEREQAKLRAGVSSEAQFAAEREVQARAKAAGIEDYTEERRSGLLGHLFGHRTTKRSRTGNYDESRSSKGSFKGRIVIYAVLAVTAVASVFIVIKLLT